MSGTAGRFLPAEGPAVMPDDRSSSESASVLVLALGNDVMGDDAVGLHVARALRSQLPPSVTIREAPVGGFELMELMEGFRHALIIDAISTGAEPGTIHQLTAEDFRKTVAGSPHYVGLPEVLHLARTLGISFPDDIRILAIEVADPFEIREGLSSSISESLGRIVDSAKAIIGPWIDAGKENKR